MSETAVSEEKLNFKKILPIFVIVLVDLLGLTIIIPLLPLYATAFGASPFIIGLLGAAYPLMQVLGAPRLGRLSDRYGRRPILIISQIGTFIGFLILGFAHVLWLIFISRIIDGISGANIATAQAAISDSTTEKTRTQGLGLIGAAFGLGFIIGPIIAFVSLALSNNNYQVPAFAAAAFSFASILLTTFWFEETLPAEKRDSLPARKTVDFSNMVSALTLPGVGILIMLMFGQRLVFAGFEQLLALFTLSRLGINGAGNAVVFVFIGILIVAVQGYFIGRWSRRFGDRRLIYAGFFLIGISLLATGFTPHQPVPGYSQAAVEAELLAQGETAVSEAALSENIAVELPDEANASWFGLIWLLIAMIPASVGGGILHPAINSLITKRVAPDQIGEMLGISTAYFSAASALAPIIGGAIFEGFGTTAPCVVWGVTMLGLWITAVRLVRPSSYSR